MNAARTFFLVTSLIAATRAVAFESDVHFGLTQWLALQAGYDAQSAATIATGDQRVDSGDMQYVDLDYMYACVGKDDVGAHRAGAHHYPSSGSLPNAPELRIVTPGGDAAMKLAIAATKIPPEQSRYRLYQLGEALHVLQDSWSHQGIPDVPQSRHGYFVCDPTRAWGHAKARGGWNSHKADITMHWPMDTVAMAKATYDTLLQFPPPPGTKRTPRKWEEIRPALTRFIAASTKAEKKNWFVAQGVSDVSFLEGISLPDGPQPIDIKWPGRKLPPLPSLQSRQHDVPAELLNFYSRFFSRWLVSVDFDAVAAEFGPAQPTAGKRNQMPAGISRAELAARLRAWRLRDHGRVAEIAHSLQPLAPSQRALLEKLGKKAGAYAHYDTPADGVFPLLPRGPQVSPLLPFFVGTARAAAGKNARAVAVAKFRHAPYDSLAVVAEKMDGQWRIVAIASTVDH
ncbi:MAG TPA: DUF6765 family protein [Casimicrobiaceae bacterium]